MAQSPLLSVGIWQKKSSIIASENKDRLISAVNKGFDAMAAVLSKDSDPEEVQCALEYLTVESSLALKFDKAKNDTLRDLVYGLLESLHGSLKEWTEERKQVKETGEIPTQTEESTVSLIGPLIRPCESSIAIDKNLSNHLPTIPYPPPLFPIDPKEEPIDNQYSLPHDYQISASELMRDEKMFMGEEMDNENTELVIPHSNPIFNDSMDLIDQGLNFTRSLPLNSVVDPIDIPPRDNQMPPLNTLRDEVDFKEEEIPNDDVIVSLDSMEEDTRFEDVENTGMGDTVNDSLNKQAFEEDDSLRTIQPSDIMDYQLNFNNEILGDRELRLSEMNSLSEVSMSIEDVDETVESQIVGEERGLPANDPIDNDGEEEYHPIDTTKDTFNYVKNEKRRRSSRLTSGPIQYDESMENSEGEDAEKSKKASFSESSKKKRKSYKGEEESADVVKKRRVSKKNETELECPECEYRTPSVNAFVHHLRRNHSTTPALAGLALLCECGHESVSEGHTRDTNHSNTTVIRKRDGPILRLDDEKATPQCVLCEMYPKSAWGYVLHLHYHHKSTLMQNGAYLKCSCGLEVRSNNTRVKHFDGCNPRQFTLHKLDEK